MRVTVAGVGKVGFFLAHYLQSLGHEVIGYDTDSWQVSRIEIEGNPYRDCERLPAQAASAGLRVTYKPHAAYSGAEAAVLIVPTPQVGDRLSSDRLRTAGDEARRLMPKAANLFIASTLDPRDAATLCRDLDADYTPVLIRLGSVFDDLKRQDLRLIGRDDPSVPAVGAIALWNPPQAEKHPWIIVSDPTTIACAKLAINATLSSRVAWANDVAVRARAFGADPAIVCKILGMDPRIGPAFLSPGFPPGGPCLPRDMDVWTSVQGQGMAEAVLVSHRITRQRILAQIMEELKSSPVKTVLVIGLTYKEGGLDWTDALGIAVVKECAKQGYEVFGYDREGTPAGTLEKIGAKRIESGQPFQADAVVIGMPGYPGELLGSQPINSLIIDPWK